MAHGLQSASTNRGERHDWAVVHLSSIFVGQMCSRRILCAAYFTGFSETHRRHWYPQNTLQTPAPKLVHQCPWTHSGGFFACPELDGHLIHSNTRLANYVHFTLESSQGGVGAPCLHSSPFPFASSQVLASGRLRAAKRREQLKHNEEAQERAREARARYRENNRELLAKKQRLVRKRAFIKKHGIHAYIQRCFDTPLPQKKAPLVQEEVSDGDDDGINAWQGHSNAQPLISPYNDPFFKRR
ncbi:hypothetical protein FB45DRAFT_1028978 [Roridomyces roridus]|uniref:Uncharacterized protein n=1 Tax=Roridomyces roridus TaxID=1738132 RepID=A0AAD7FK98_9AGAR|nr:hypothetical protein FB45DRAFT_1028978 [Roridomyces roridus]